MLNQLFTINWIYIDPFHKCIYGLYLGDEMNIDTHVRQKSRKAFTEFVPQNINYHNSILLPPIAIHR